MEIQEEEIKQSRDYDDVDNFFYNDKSPLKFSNEYMMKKE